MNKIFEKERKTFLGLWHKYHAKHNIAYSHDEAHYFFECVCLIFNEDKDMPNNFHINRAQSQKEAA
jgi:hypothetical protein